MQKTKKMKLQGLGVAACSVALVAAVSFGMTGAWFTDTLTTDAATVTMGHNVIIDHSFANFQLPLTDSAHNGSRMPGDTVGFTGGVKMSDDSSEAYLRFKVNVTGLDNFVGATLALEVEGTTLDLSGSAYTYYTTPVVSGDWAVINGSLILPGDTILNDAANKTLTVTIDIEAIQSANVTVTNGNSWTYNAGTTEAPVTTTISDDLVVSL